MRIATLGICGLLLLTSCTSSGDDDDGPGPVADQLAEALAGKDLSGVPWRSTEPVDLESLFGPLADVPAAVDVTEVDEQDDQATATLAWTWDFSGNEWTYETPAALAKTGNEWKVTWAPTIVEPSLKEGETLDVDTLLAERGDILGAGGRRLVKARDVVRYGLDKTMVKAAGVASSARRIAQVLDIDPAPYVKQAAAAGPKAFVEAIVLRDADARKIDPSLQRHPRCRGGHRHAAARPDRRLRGADPRPGRPGHRRADRGVRRRRCRKATSSGFPACRRGTTSSSGQSGSERAGRRRRRCRAPLYSAEPRRANRWRSRSTNGSSSRRNGSSKDSAKAIAERHRDRRPAAVHG